MSSYDTRSEENRRSLRRVLVILLRISAKTSKGGLAWNPITHTNQTSINLHEFNKRDLTEAAITAALTKAGCDIEYVYRMPYDIIVGRANMTFLLEIKTGKAKLKPSQELFRASWRGHYAVVRTVDEALEAVGIGGSSLGALPRSIPPK